jgi:hypothetical protein
MFGRDANDVNPALSLDDLTLGAHLFDRTSDFHNKYFGFRYQSPTSYEWGRITNAELGIRNL